MRVITGTEQLNLNIEKPNLDLQFISLNYASVGSDFRYNYNLEVNNTGYQTSEDVIVQFFCANVAGDDIMGSVIHADTINMSIANNSTAMINGSFLSTCDPTVGIAALITPGVSSCYCESLDDLASKASGLSEIPHDLKSSVSLPVEISSLAISSQDCSMHLKWATASETNNKFFEVQKSNDGQYFYTLGAFAGQGNSSTETHYEYLDTEWRGEQLSYYRLKQVDIDGTFSFSKIVSGQWEDCYAPNTISNIYPNPVSQDDFINIEFLKEDDSDIIIKMTDLLGQTIKSLHIQNAIQGSNVIKMSMADITSGTYFISIQSLENKWRIAMHKINVFKD